MKVTISLENEDYKNLQILIGNQIQGVSYDNLDHDAQHLKTYEKNLSHQASAKVETKSERNLKLSQNPLK